MATVKPNKIKRYPSSATFKQEEYTSDGILSETPWTVLDKIYATDNVPTVSGTIQGIVAPAKVSNPKTVADDESNVDCVHHYGTKQGGGSAPYGTEGEIWWENTCYSTTCKGKTHDLKWSPKNASYDEWTCPHCSTDFDCMTGKSKTYTPGADGHLHLCPGHLPNALKTPLKSVLKANLLSGSVAGHITTKAAKIITSGYGYAINLNSKINSIELIWKPWVKNASGTELAVPTIPGAKLSLTKSTELTDKRTIGFYGANRSTVFSGDSIKAITPAIINNKNFQAIINPNRNTSVNAGKLYIDFAALNVEVIDPKYSLSAFATSGVKIGSLITYRLTLKNTNKVHNGYDIPVSINVPDGLVYQSSNGTYNSNTKKWNAKLNKSGVAEIIIVFESVTAGNKIITASVDSFNTVLTKPIEIKGPVYTLNSTLPQKITQGQTHTFNVTLKSDSPLNETVLVTIPIPSGCEYISSDPMYHPVSQVWEAQLNNAMDTVSITIQATTPGTYNQTITAPGAVWNNTITVIPSNLGECNYVEMDLPDSLKVYLQDGVEYIISNEMEIVSALTGEVFDGYENFSIAVLVGEDEEEKEDGYEIIGTSPQLLNRYERVYAKFTYDENTTTTIRLYGQYEGLDPNSYYVRFGKWSISNTTEDYEKSGGLFDDPSCLCTNGSFTQVTLDPGESTKPLILANINMAGLEFDSDLIVKGLGVQLDYVCSDIPILNITISDGSQTATKSVPMDPSSSLIEIGGEDDKWDIKNIDLANLTVTMSITNVSLATTAIQAKNLQFNLYHTVDETEGNIGVYIDDEHSKNYSLFFGDYPDKNEGIASDLTTYDISNSQGELVCAFDLKAKKIVLKYNIEGCSLAEVQDKLKAAAKYLNNDLNSMKLPIPKKLVCEWDPDRTFMYVIEDEIKVKEKNYCSFDCEATLLIPDGVGYSDLNSHGPIGTNEGLIEARPLINVVTTGGNVQIFNNVSYQSITILNDFDEGVNLIIDCEKRIIVDTAGNDYSKKISLNSTWSVILTDFDFSNSTGCLIQNIQFKEGS